MKIKLTLMYESLPAVSSPWPLLLQAIELMAFDLEVVTGASITESCCRVYFFDSGGVNSYGSKYVWHMLASF